MTEGDRLQPGDADVNSITVVATWHFQVLAFGGATPDEDRIVAGLQKLLHPLHRRRIPDVAAQVQDGANPLLKTSLRETERRDIGAHQPTWDRLLLEDRALIAQRQQVVRHRPRSRTGAHAGNPLPVLLRRNL